MIGLKDTWILMTASCGVAMMLALLAPPITITGKVGAVPQERKRDETNEKGEDA